MAADWPEIREAVPGVNNLMLTFATPAARPRAVAARGFWPPGRTPSRLPLQGRVIELPVVYGGDGGPHLADVIAHTGLGVDELVDRHTAPLYPVYAIGSHPGYCYLGGMDERIATPRRKVPVLQHPRRRRLDRRQADRRLGLAGPERLEHDRQHLALLLRPGALAARAAAARRRDPLPRREGDPMIEIIATAGLATRAGSGPLRQPALRRRPGRRDGPRGAGCRQHPAGQRRGRGRRSRCQLFPFTARFTADCGFAIDRRGLRGAAGRARAAALVGLSRAGRPGARARPAAARRWRASRAYLALPGGVDVPEVLGSRSTQLRGAFGGLEGRFLQSRRRSAGRPTRATAPAGFGLVPPALALPLARRRRRAGRSRASRRRILLLHACLAGGCSGPGEWKITAQSDRYGYRLAGTALGVRRAGRDAVARHRARA